MSDSKPVTITAAQWHTVADAVKRGECTCHDYFNRDVIEVYRKRDNYLMVLARDKWKPIPLVDRDVEFTLTWRDSEPAPLDALFDAILNGIGHGAQYDEAGATAALETLRQRVAAVEAERDALRKGLNEVKSELNRLYDEVTNGRQNQSAPGAFEYAGLEGFVRQILNTSKQS